MFSNNAKEGANVSFGHEPAAGLCFGSPLSNFDNAFLQ